MAKKAQQKNGARRPKTDANLPAGFDPLEFGRVAGWFKLEKGNSVQGRIVDSFTTNGKYGERRVYKVEITAGQTDCTLDDEDVTAEVGDVVGVDEKGFLKRLADVPEGAEIFVRCAGKDAPSKDFPQGAWRFDLGIQSGVKLKARAPKQNAGKGRQPGEDDGPLPF